jgi:DNA-binding response OmpR family regulator
MADPDVGLQDMYREALAKKDIEVVAAFSGLECIARMRDRVPDALVLEPHLPWGGGDGVLAMMGEVHQLANVPVMVLTSGRDPHVLNRVGRFPVCSYHLKPLEPNRLAEKLHVMLQGPRLPVTMAEQTGRMEMSIAKRTRGQVRNLRIETIDGRIIVSGRANSYYVKQLAIAAVREAFAASESQSDRIAVEIDVQQID